jgi:hypothetical protein
MHLAMGAGNNSDLALQLADESSAGPYAHHAPNDQGRQ